MALVSAPPRIDTPIVIPYFGGDPTKTWEWLKKYSRATGREDLIHQVKETGNCRSQTITKVGELSALLKIPINKGIFKEGCRR